MGKGAKAPTPYMPTGQGAADSGYQQLVSNASLYASALPGQVIPGLQQAATNVGNNPYYDTAMSGANFAANAATQQVAPNMLQANTNLTNLGNGASDYAGIASMAGIGAGQQALDAGQNSYAAGQNVYNQAQSLMPSTTQGASMAPNVYQQLMSMIPGTTQGGLNAADPMLIDGLIKAQQLYGTAYNAIPGLTGGMDQATQLLNNGFDPQGQLRDREYQKTMDQQNALNSMYGVSSSPYGAGVAGQRAQDFGLDWQDRQLGRQVAALGAYGTQQGQVANNLTSLLNTASSGYNDTTKNAAMNYEGLTQNAANNASTLANSATKDYTDLTSNTANNFATLAGAGTSAMDGGSTALNQGVDNYRQALAGAVGNYSNLVNTAGNAYNTAGQQGIDAVQTVAAGTLAPSQTYLGQQQAYIQALQALAQGGTQSLAPTNSLIDQQGDYLGIGQNATSVAQNATQINNANRNAQLAGIGSLVGTVAGIALAPATGGLSLFGLGAAKAAG